MENNIHEESKRQILRQSFEKLKADASEILRCIPEMNVLLKRNMIVEARLEKRSVELDLKEKELQCFSSELEQKCRIFEEEKAEAGDLKKLVEDCREELRLKRNQLTEMMEMLTRTQSELESKDTRLREVTAEIARRCVEERAIEGETDRKKKELALILDRIQESGKELESQSLELVSKEKELEHVRESIKLSNSDLELKDKMVQSLNNRIRDCGKKVDSKSRELGEIEELVEKRTNELSVMHKRLDSMRLLSEELVAKEKQHKEILEAICKSSSEMESTKIEAKDLNAKSRRLGREVEDKEEELDQVKNQIKSEGDELTRLRKSIQDCTSELSSRRDQVEAMKKIQRELQLNKQLSQKSSVQPASAPVNDTSQQNKTETDPDVEDILTDPEISTLLKRNDVSSVLRGSLNPAEYVLELVQGDIGKELDLHDSLMTNWVLIFEELNKIQRADDPQVQLKAKQVATLWKEKISIEAPKSSLEVLAFLLFIVAYGLTELINEEETSLLASSIAQYKQAPLLFNSLSLKREMREFVKDLIKKSQYIPAVRLICLFDLIKEFSPLELLMKEIINLKQKRPTESSQAKDKVAGRLRAILELVAVYKLEIDLPGDLVTKLMVQRENSTPPLVQCKVKYANSSSNPQDNSPCLALLSAQRSSVNRRISKVEVKSYSNPLGNGIS